jgi:hypothetical protein
MGASPVNRRPLVGSGETENVRRHHGGQTQLFFPGQARICCLGRTPAAPCAAPNATVPGTYRYLCPVPGHAQKGMAGVFIVTS